MRATEDTNDVILVIMKGTISIIGAGLAGSEAALHLADRGHDVILYEMRPRKMTEVHRSGLFAELVCSNSLKGTRSDSAAGMLKNELSVLGSALYARALDTAVPAGGALAVDREAFSSKVTQDVRSHPHISLAIQEAVSIQHVAKDADAVIVSSGPLTSDSLAQSLLELTSTDELAFFDAAAPIVMTDSLDMTKVFRQSRYEDPSGGDYLNAPLSREEYTAFIHALIDAKKVIAKEFETKELFQACQPIEEIARKGIDAPRFGPMKPVGLTDPATGKRPYAAVQLRFEDRAEMSCNLVGFQTNLTFDEQKRVFRMIPGLEHAEFARYGVMHRNTFIDAPKLLDGNGRLTTAAARALGTPIYIAGQLAGTEGYCEAIRSGLHCAIAVDALLSDVPCPSLPHQTAFGALMAYASDRDTIDYQPMHVNLGILPPLDEPIKNKRQRYAAYAVRASSALEGYAAQLAAHGLIGSGATVC